MNNVTTVIAIKSLTSVNPPAWLRVGSFSGAHIAKSHPNALADGKLKQKIKTFITIQLNTIYRVIELNPRVTILMCIRLDNSIIGVYL